MKSKPGIVISQVIQNKTMLIRGEKFMLDADLAKLCGVSTKRLNEQLRRNLGRFPSDFMSQLTREEYAAIEDLDVFTIRRGQN